jgi:signal transduction histidine kinase
MLPLIRMAFVADAGAIRRVGMASGRQRVRTRGTSAAVALLATTLPLEASPMFTTTQVAGSAIIVGLGLFSALCGVAVLKAQRRIGRIRKQAEDRVADLADRLARAEAFQHLDDQMLLVWSGDGAPAVEGALLRVSGVPREPAGLAAFDGWLAPESAATLGAAVAGLRARGEAFAVSVRTRRGDHLEADGRAAGGSAILRLRDSSVERAELARVVERQGEVARELDSLRRLLEEAPQPAWLRDASGALVWANPAYARAVSATDAASAVERRLEFLDASATAELEAALAAGRVWRRRITATFGGPRRVFDVTMTPVAGGSAGIATDVSDVEAGRVELERQVAAHQRTLDALKTPVAIFGPDRRLVYHNPAWRELWGLDLAYLSERPDEGAILDRLRASRRLPEQANYREWKAQYLAAYGRGVPRQMHWHLPDGRTIRNDLLPNPDGGITLVQENETEVLDLKARSLAFERMQRETLDALTDAVIVFGSDGRLKLWNPAFAAMWRLEAKALNDGPHVDDLIASCRDTHDDPATWEGLRRAVFALSEDRRPLQLRIERRDGSIFDLATAPLPEGATLATFVDVTASANVERALKDKADALREKNDALVVADRLKNAFVQHVSYELRSPLTNIIGFAQLLSDPTFGPLNTKQHEYMGYIMSSSSSLLAIINDILDLATIDAGVMQLDLTRVDVEETVAAAVEGLRDRVAEEGVALDVDVPADIGTFTADAKRVRQVLYNLLSNAVGFSERGMVVRLSARRMPNGELHFNVIDRGRGMDAELLARVFERFETQTAGTRHRGVGLGLSIVKSFVELHGGEVRIESAPGRGTSVTVAFPAIAREAAPEKAA